MARRRGFFSELQHQSQIAAREKAKRAREAERAHNAAIRAAEKSRKDRERAAAKQVRTDAAEQKRLAKETREARISEMEVEVEKLNAELAVMYEENDSLLAATLRVDDYLDLMTLCTEAEHPPFDRADLEMPIPAPSPIPDPPEPTLASPPPPKGLAGLLGKKRHEAAVAAATQAYQNALQEWRNEVNQAESARQAAAQQHADMEAKRVGELESERARFREECAAREAAVAERNSAIEELNTNLGYGTVEAVEEYVSLIFSRSVYPVQFPVEHDFEFDPATAELRLRVLVPSPDKVPTTNTYKYTKSTDEITSSALSKKACKDRYTSAVMQTALRSLHEVFEADRRGLIKTISLEVETETIDPATGRETRILFLAAGAERDSFLALDLANVVPTATLSHLGAAVSKSPYDLVAAHSAGIRQS